MTLSCVNTYIFYTFFIVIVGNTWSAHWIASHNEKKKCESAAANSSLLRRERVQVYDYVYYYDRYYTFIVINDHQITYLLYTIITLNYSECIFFVYTTKMSCCCFIIIIIIILLRIHIIIVINYNGVTILSLDVIISQWNTS